MQYRILNPIQIMLFNEERLHMAKRESSVSNTTSGKAKDSKSILLITVIAVSVIIIALLSVIIFVLANQKTVEQNTNPVGEARATIITKDNVEEVMEKAAEPVEAGYYNCQMNVEWHFKDAAEPSYDAYVANSNINTHTVYFDLTLEDSNELVYSSPYMPVNSELDEILLTKDLDAGTYPALVTYHLVDEEKNDLSTVSVTVTLIIEN